MSYRRRTALMHVLVGGFQPMGGRHLQPLGLQARQVVEQANPIPPVKPFELPAVGVDTRLHTKWELKPHFSV